MTDERYEEAVYYSIISVVFMYYGHTDFNDAER
jgi:hypothetical protein